MEESTGMGDIVRHGGEILKILRGESGDLNQIGSLRN